MAILVTPELLSTFKKSIGDLNGDALDNYYTEQLEAAIAEFSAEDISETQLQSDLGKKAIVFYAKILMNGGDIATNPTINLHKIKLSLATKGERVKNVQQ
jgi:hypothetical protein